MSDSRERKTVEVLGVFFAFSAAAPAAPSLLRALGLPRLVPASLKRALLCLPLPPDAWLLWAFTVMSVGLALWLSARRNRSSEKVNLESYAARADALIRRRARLRVVRTLGLAWVRDRVVERMGIAHYGTFSRTVNHWPSDSDRFDWVDRLRFEAGDGVEYQYSRDYSELIVRTHAPDNLNFGSELRRPVQRRDFKLLWLSSDHFLRWYLKHLLQRGCGGWGSSGRLMPTRATPTTR